MRSCLSCWQQNVTFFMLRAASSVPVLRSRQILEVVCRLSLSPMKIRVYNGNREVNSSQKEKHRASKRCPKFWYSANRGGTTPGFLFRQAISRQHLFNRLRLMMRFDRRARCCLQNGVPPAPGVFVCDFTVMHAGSPCCLACSAEKTRAREAAHENAHVCMICLWQTGDRVTAHHFLHG